MNARDRRLLDTVKFSSYVASFAEPGRHVLGVESYAYVVDQTGLTLTSAAAQEFELVMDSDSDFVATFASGAAIVQAPVIGSPANGNTCTEFAASILVQITDQASGKTWYNQPTPLPLIAGAGGFPFIMASPRVIRPRGALTVSVQAAASGVTFSAFYFALHGGKIYYAGPTP